MENRPSASVRTPNVRFPALPSISNTTCARTTGSPVTEFITLPSTVVVGFPPSCRNAVWAIPGAAAASSRQSPLISLLPFRLRIGVSFLRDRQIPRNAIARLEFHLLASGGQIFGDQQDPRILKHQRSTIFGQYLPRKCAAEIHGDRQP